MRVIIIGCTYAGMTAAAQILRSHPETEVTIYDRNAVVPSLSYDINDYADQNATRPELRAELSPQQLTVLGADVKMGYLLMSINPAQKTVRVMGMLDDQTTEEHYDKLIIATDATVDKPAIEGIDSMNVALFKDELDAKVAIISAAIDRRICVVGNSPLALALVDAYRQKEKEVTLITNGQPVLHGEFADEYSQRATKLLTDANVKVVTDQHVTKLADTGLGVSVNTNGGSYDADKVVMAAKAKPDTDIYKGELDLNDEGAIVTDKFMQTSAADVYAIGGSTDIHYNPTNSNIYDPQASEVVRQAIIAADNVMGKQIADSGTQLSVGVNLCGTTMASVGLTLERAQQAGIPANSVMIEDNYRPEFMPTTAPVLMTLVWNQETREIIGAQMMSKHDISESLSLISLCMQNKNTIDFLGMYDTMFQPNFDRAFNYVNLLGQAAMGKAEADSE
ncbi:FAD-dependent oxidoreductase [Limosilactobacillus caccae]|uniref:FAD-dependent oxidoreductase n=1 Tax=Limosilactobacillus caccae TaxID=1926284 RepID=UPI000971484C|nr:FAD-dependent oxidoreductase [Limosilactobacillus caccae]